ncbi:hypothetical protein Sjap_024182 [Stephania japonica]|uniref:N-acetyltransferase domain-containing protein n=1 Tax=Stephania japonica TaxID=461633 RepID=A0AAP0HPW7_9MAGN
MKLHTHGSHTTPNQSRAFVTRQFPVAPFKAWRRVAPAPNIMTGTVGPKAPRRPSRCHIQSMNVEVFRNPDSSRLVPSLSQPQSFYPLASRGFTLHTTPAALNLDHLNTVFVAVGFPKRDPAKIRTALDHTDAVLWVEHTKSSGKPVAFARATGDGVFNAIIWDVVVDPSFQGIGLGKAVMERLVAVLLERGIVNIALYAEPRVVGFYRPLGFAADPGGIRGMVYSRKQQKKR